MGAPLEKWGKRVAARSGGWAQTDLERPFYRVAKSASRGPRSSICMSGERLGPQRTRTEREVFFGLRPTCVDTCRSNSPVLAHLVPPRS